MAKEIKIVIGKGGKVKMLADKASSGETAAFTEKLAKELGEIEERHKSGHVVSNETKNELKQEN